MSTKQDVLRLLYGTTNKPLSGQEIAEELNLSRTAVWKAIQQLKKDGYEITSSTKVGYQLSRKIDLLTLEGIRTHLGEELQDWDIQVFETTTSTNDLAKTYGASGSRVPTFFISEEQTAGRGRLGRTFLSPPKSGLYMSICIFPEGDLDSISLVTCATAVAATRAVESFIKDTVGIKWVNDLYYHDKKIAGILTEAVTNIEAQKVDALIVGMGINLHIDDAIIPEDLKPIIGSLFSPQEIPDSFSRNEFVARFLKEWKQCYEDINSGNRDFMEEYKTHSIIVGKKINVISGMKTYPAIAKSVDNNGHLIVQTDDGAIHSLSYGEVSIRPQS